MMGLFERLTVTDANPIVSVQLWIYFAVTVPITGIILAVWMWFDRRRERQYSEEDADLEKTIGNLEQNIMNHLRRRTMSKANTWNTITTPVKP